LDSYKADLNPLQKKYKWSPYYYSIMGIIYIILGVLNYFIQNYSFLHGLIWVIGGILFLIGGYYQTNFSSKYFFELNDRFVKFKDSVKSERNIEWSNIREIQLKPITIEFSLNENVTESISLGNVCYKNVLDIKEKLLDFAANKGISLS
jgi:hypothetical protein